MSKAIFILKKGLLCMKKRILGRFFCYRDCDAFAGFLHEQSLHGWHFKEFRFGLVFEQGEPADIYYTVEVFPKGTEMDTRPEKDTEEYAEYCEAAGWKLLDSSRKFCVFRRTREDAVPIVEPEERFENIRKAEWLLWLSSAIPVFLLSGIQWGQLLTWNFKNWIFHDLMPLLLLFMTSACIERLIEGISLAYWSLTKKRMLKSGNIPVYGWKRRWITKSILFIIYFLPLFFLVFYLKRNFVPYLLPAVISLILLLLVTIWIAFRRPARNDNYILQTTAGIGIFFCICITMIASVLCDPDPEYTPKDAQEFPLIQADYRQMNGEITMVNADHMENVLGSKSYFLVVYTQKGSESDSLSYTIYQSSHPWILDRLWADELPDQEAHQENRAGIWEAVLAVSYRYGNGIYHELVRYPDRILVLRSDKKLDEHQIKSICEKRAFYK